ncbi:MAG: hypothetical protein ACI8ZO_000722 [Flavobacteriales bacterium]|jgi:hypothetical protein
MTLIKTFLVTVLCSRSVYAQVPFSETKSDNPLTLPDFEKRFT